MAQNNDPRPMDYRIFGRTGIRASQLILGAMTFGDAWGDFGANPEESRKIFEAYAARGGNFIDTANSYTGGQSEEIVGGLIAGNRDRFVLATKYTFNPTSDDPNAGGNHRKNIVRSLDASLKRLGTDYVDIYWLHVWDYTTPIEEIVRALDDQVRAGKILHPAVSDTPAWIAAQGNTVARMRGWSQFAALQIEWNLLARTVEDELVAMARSFGMPITPWSPLAGGMLTGKYRGNGTQSKSLSLRESFLKPLDERGNNTMEALMQTARELDATPAQVALAWLLAQGDDVFPILGARRLDQFEDNMGALDVRLTGEQLQRLSDASAPARTFPHEFLERLVRDGLPVRLFGVPAERVRLPARGLM
jgi:aryl-alcohol dehydrogenase-like predicted oxidoreductase